MKRNKTILLILAMVFNVVTYLNAQELFMTSIAPLSELAGSIPQDFKIKPTSGSASSYQSGENIEKAYDGNFSSMYHSTWGIGNTQFPVTLVFNLPEEDIDYLIYHPRNDGIDNGNIQEFELWYNTTSDTSQEIKIGDYNFLGSKNSTRIDFGETLENVKYFKFVIHSGILGFVNCAEMEFYKNNPAKSVGSELFKDNLMTELKPGVTLEDIDNMENSFFRELAMSMYRGSYSLDFRVGEYFPYMDRQSMDEIYMVDAYNLYENPTGIYFPLGKSVVIVENLEAGRSIGLVIPNYTGGDENDWSLYSRSYSLQNGINVIDVTGWGGLGYISYFTPEWEEAGSIKVHIPQGIVQGYFDASKHTNEDFVRILANANAYPFMDMVGKRTQLAYKVEAYREHTRGQAVELLARYDTMIIWQQRYLGWEKYLTLPKNRIHCRGNQSYYMYKDGTGASFIHASMGILANPTTFYNDNWGPNHEVGHIHQYEFNNWSGMGEVSVNFPNIIFERQVLKPNDTDPNGSYDKAYNSIPGNNVSTITVPFLYYRQDVFPEGTVDHNWGRLVAFAQLYHYFLEVGNPNFYPDLNHALRETTESRTGWGPAQYELHFIKKACDVAQLNLIPFFEKWGMLYYTDQDGREPFLVRDYSDATYNLPKTDVDNLKAYIQEKEYPVPAQDITLIKPNGGRITP